MRILLAIMLVLLSAPAWAHKPSDSYLSLTVQQDQVEGRWDIALRDLDDAIGLDRDGDGAITWGEVRVKQDEIAAYALSRLTLTSAGQPCRNEARDHLIDNHTDGAYAVLLFMTTCQTLIHGLQADYRLLFDLDAQHKGLLRLTDGQQTTTAIFSQQTPRQQFAIGDRSRWREALQFVREGIWHIWLGFDHVLFLIALLLPAVLVRVEDRWEAGADFSSVWWSVVSIVTAFTVAHSLTLSLATLGVVRLPSRFVESAIAASVVLAGLGNLYPTLIRRRWLVAFGFGLIHGFGFAAVLSDLGLQQGSLLLSLISFNVGVEIGQLFIVAAFLPLAYGLRHTWTYQRVIVAAGSLTIAAVALLWLIERAFNLKLLFA